MFAPGVSAKSAFGSSNSELGGTSVDYVQKLRPELKYGWSDPVNAEKRAAEEGFEVNSLPRVNAIFIDKDGPYGIGSGHVGIVRSVSAVQIDQQDYFRLLIEDSDAATYQKVRRNTLMWVRVDPDKRAIFDPNVFKNSGEFSRYTLGENPTLGRERVIRFIHEKKTEYERKRQDLANIHNTRDAQHLDRAMSLKRDLVYYLIDRSGSMRGQGGQRDLRALVRDRIHKHVDGLGENAEVAIQFFNSQASATQKWHPFNADKQAAFKEYFAQEFRPDGSTRLFDTVHEATEFLSSQVNTYNQIEFIIYSDGEDNASSAEAQNKRWSIIGSNMAQLTAANPFMRSYLFTLGYELDASDLRVLEEMGVAVTSIAVDKPPKRDHLDKLVNKNGEVFYGKVLSPEIVFENQTRLVTMSVRINDIIHYSKGVLTRSREELGSEETEVVSEKAKPVGFKPLKFDNGERSLTISHEQIAELRTGKRLLSTEWGQSGSYVFTYNPRKDACSAKSETQKDNPDQPDYDEKAIEYRVGCTSVAVGQLVNYYFERDYRDGWLQEFLKNVEVFPRFDTGKEILYNTCRHGGFTTRENYPNRISTEEPWQMPEESRDLKRFLWSVALGLDSYFQVDRGWLFLPDELGVTSGAHHPEPDGHAAKEEYFKTRDNTPWPEKFRKLLYQRFRFAEEISYSANTLDRENLLTTLSSEKEKIVDAISRAEPILMYIAASKKDDYAGHMVVIDNARLYSTGKLDVQINWGWANSSGENNIWYSADKPIVARGYKWERFLLFWNTTPINYP